ncbi:MAG: hypothetical protein ACU836_02140 [Gammaproteobacteria bacterium]
MTSRQYLFGFLIGSFSLLFLIGAFNRIVDPFWYYRDTSIVGFNEIRPKFRKYERHVKPALLNREKPEAIILGSSFSEIGFDPTNKYFSADETLKVMNFALAGAPWSLALCSFKFAIKHSNIKRILLGIHPEAMPSADCEKEYPDFGRIDVSELLFSIRATDASIGTISGQKKNKPSHTQQGMYFYIRHHPGIDQQFRLFFSRRLQNNPKCAQTFDEKQAKLANISELDLTGLKDIIAIAKERNIELALFAYPSHAYSQELTLQCGEFDQRWGILKQIAKLVSDEAAGDNVTIWHFYGYNDITNEAITSGSATYWQDPEHFNFEVGDLMLETIFGNSNSAQRFGHRITYETIDDERQAFMARRRDFLNSHKEFQNKLRSLL